MDVESLRRIMFSFRLSESNNYSGFVKKSVDSLMEMLRPTMGNTVKRPPRCQIMLGSFFNEECILTSLTAEYTDFFDPSGLQPKTAMVAVGAEFYEQ